MSDVERRAVRIEGGQISLMGDLWIPDAALGVVVFAHGSGSGRTSPRNMAVARMLNDAGLATLLFDLPSEDEAGDRRNVFDIPFLASRLALAIALAGAHSETQDLPIGLFGASTGAAAALWTAGEPAPTVAAVVSRGGRPDLAEPRLAAVEAPTLLIVGGADHEVLELNRRAQRELRCTNELRVVADATHLFEEPGAMDEVAALASDWFVRFL